MKKRLLFGIAIIICVSLFFGCNHIPQVNIPSEATTGHIGSTTTSTEATSQTESTTTSTEATSQTEGPLPSPEAVFNTENIKRITFYGYYGAGKGNVVPAAYISEITNWLDSFSIDREVDEILYGANTYYIEIEYLDGTVIKEGLDIIEVNGVSYFLKKDPYPDCFYAIFGLEIS